ncbi:MAG: hypothetical protein J6L88_04450 [Clostridia bacterium]|nr:hypothetical protein [Clostridia bacterium]
MRSVEQEYKRLNESVMPSDELIARTRALMQAELSQEKVQSRAKKRLIKKAASYVAVAAASALICVGVMTTLPRAKSEAEANDAAAPMESIVEEEVFEEAVMQDASVEESLTADRADNEMGQANGEAMEYADIFVYVVDNGEVEPVSVEQVECSIDAVIAAWAQQNGLQDVVVQSVDVQDSGASLGVHIDFAKGFDEKLDADGLILASLSMTLGDYLNADGVILTCDGMPL